MMPDIHVRAKSAGMLYALNGVAPTIHPTAWVAPTAVLIGDVRLGPGANIWFNCVLRADTNPIVVGARTNIQDGTIIHVDHGENFTDIGDDVTIGHGAIIHACKLRNRAFVGMGATVLDGAVIEDELIVIGRGDDAETDGKGRAGGEVDVSVGGKLAGGGNAGGVAGCDRAASVDGCGRLDGACAGQDAIHGGGGVQQAIHLEGGAIRDGGQLGAA